RPSEPRPTHARNATSERLWNISGSRTSRGGPIRTSLSVRLPERSLVEPVVFEPLVFEPDVGDAIRFVRTFPYCNLQMYGKREPCAKQCAAKSDRPPQTEYVARGN